jgi:hypothetical protein
MLQTQYKSSESVVLVRLGIGWCADSGQCAGEFGEGKRVAKEEGRRHEGGRTRERLR